LTPTIVILQDQHHYSSGSTIMNYQPLHAWPTNASEAIALQQQLRSQLLTPPLPRTARLIAGADISFEKYSNQVYAGFVVIDLDQQKIVDQAVVTTTANFPYIPGLLSFREAPPLLAAWQQLATCPDVIIFDGQGIAHPRRFGLAAHLGLILDRPALGCAKTLLVGQYAPLAAAVGSTSPLMHQGEIVGVALRTKKNTNPVFVSTGHRIDLAGAVNVVMASLTRYRLPEPTRQAHLLVNRYREAAKLI
jgi:deoxyribonuclease V